MLIKWIKKTIKKFIEKRRRIKYLKMAARIDFIGKTAVFKSKEEYEQWMKIKDDDIDINKVKILPYPRKEFYIK